MGLLQLLKSLFGQKYLNKIIGTRTNVAKPIRMDKSSPFKRYSDSAYDDPEIIALIEKKIDEYGPYALSNKNPQELANFEDNAKRLLAVKNKQTGTTPGMVESMKPKPEAEMFEFQTKGKLDDEGIMTLKEDMGLPPDVKPDSPIGKILNNRNKINQTFKQMGTAAQDVAEKAYSAGIEGKRRAAVRQMLLKDKRINLSSEEVDSLASMKDLQKNANPDMDPLVLLNKYYKRDNKKLEMLDDVIDESLNPKDAADNFLAKDETLEVLDEDLGTRLEDYDGDPDSLANGGRPGYAFGTGKSIITFIIENLVKKKNFDPDLLKRVSGQKNGEKLLKELYEKEIGELPLATADKASTKVKAQIDAEPNILQRELMEVSDDVSSSYASRDTKYNAQVLADGLAEKRYNVDISDLDQYIQMGLYDEAYKYLTQLRMNFKQPEFPPKAVMDNLDAEGLANIMRKKGIDMEVGTASKTTKKKPNIDPELQKSEDSKKIFNDFSTRLSKPTKTLEGIKKKGTIDISDDEIMEEFETFMRETDPEGMKPIDALVEKLNLKGKKRTDNAEGGRIGFSAGSIKAIGKAGLTGFQKLRELIRNLAKERGTKGSDILKVMNYKNLNPAIKNKLSKAEFDKFKLEVQKGKLEQLENFREMFQSRVTFKEAIEKGKAMDDGGSGMSDIFRYLDEDFSKRSPVPRDINEDDVLMMDQLIKNQTVKDDPRKLNAQGGLNYLMGL